MIKPEISCPLQKYHGSSNSATIKHHVEPYCKCKTHLSAVCFQSICQIRRLHDFFKGRTTIPSQLPSLYSYITCFSEDTTESKLPVNAPLLEVSQIH